jgi:uroporphyrinogen decarboxylase
MNSKDRFIITLEGGKADRMPVTMHHIMPSFLEDYMGGISGLEFFDFLGIDPINWVMAYQYSADKGEYFDPLHTSLGFLEALRVCSDKWQIGLEPREDSKYTTQRFNIVTPGRRLSMVLQSNEHTTWLAEPLL